MSVQDQDDKPKGDPAGDMIAWLAGKPQDVWLAAIDHLNPDTSDGVLKWMVSQPQCDLAVAAHLLWSCRPADGLRPGSLPWRRSASGAIGTLIIANLDKGYYGRNTLRLPIRRDAASIAAYRSGLEHYAGKVAPVEISAAFFGPFRGSKPFVPRHLRPQHNPELWDLYAALGSQIGSRPDPKRPFSELLARLLRTWNDWTASFNEMPFENGEEQAAYLKGDVQVQAILKRRRLARQGVIIWQWWRPWLLTIAGAGLVMLLISSVAPALAP